MIEIVVEGTPYTGFIDVSVNVRLDAMANDFSFTASAVTGFPPLKYGDEVQVLVDGVIVLTGHVDEVNGAEQEGTHTVTYSGRDKTADFVDSQVNAISDLKPSESLTLKSVIETVLSHLALSLDVVDNVAPAAFNLAEDIIAPSVGENAFDFVRKWAQKRQVLLSSNGLGNIAILQSSPLDSGAVLQRVDGGKGNNILAQAWSIGGNNLFRKYVSRGQLSPSALNFSGGSTSSDVEDQGGEYEDTAGRPGRQKVQVESESYSSEQLLNRAKWSSQLAKAKATRFSCTTLGHQMPQGGVWDVNTLVLVNSSVADINRKMLLNGVNFVEGEGRPTVSNLEFVERDVYTISDKILSQRPTGSLNDAFKALG